jgi:hypothetical protein
MELIHEFTYRAQLDAPLVIGPGPVGMRMVVNVSGGTVTGKRIEGSVIGPAGDWLVLGSDGFARIDVRAQIRTSDDAILALSLVGLLEANEVTTAASATGGETSFEDGYFRSTVRLEAGDERYSWVNRTLFVARSRLLAGGVEHEVYRVA